MKDRNDWLTRDDGDVEVCGVSVARARVGWH